MLKEEIGSLTTKINDIIKKLEDHVIPYSNEVVLNPPEQTSQELSTSPMKVDIGVNTNSDKDDIIPQLYGAMEHSLDSSYSPFNCEICEQVFLHPDDFIIH